MKRRVHKRWPDKTIRLSSPQLHRAVSEKRETLPKIWQYAIIVILVAALIWWVLVPMVGQSILHLFGG